MIETCKPLYENAIPAKGKANQRIRKALIDAGMYQWELAVLLGVGESTLVRNLRVELPKEKQDQIIKLIQEHTKEGG